MNDIPRSEIKRYLHGDKFHQYWDEYYKETEGSNELVNLYFDFPYCVSNCKYCMIQPANLNKCKDDVPIYEEELVKHVSTFKDIIYRRPIGLISFGGGTASQMSRDCVRGIINGIGEDVWRSAKCIKMEVHPRDLDEEYIMFLIDEVGITHMSIGIQSFDRESNANQHRITCNMQKLKDCVELLHKYDICVNIDLVALFDGETEHHWQLFRNDLRILQEFIHPDMIFTQVNYATGKRYYEHSYRLRKEICHFVDMFPEYQLAEDRYRKFDMNDVQRFFDTTYFIIRPQALAYLKRERLFSRDVRFCDYIGFGGNFNHRVFSLTSRGDKIYSHYDFIEKRWLHELTATKVPDKPKEGTVTGTIDIKEHPEENTIWEEKEIIGESLPETPAPAIISNAVEEMEGFGASFAPPVGDVPEDEPLITVPTISVGAYKIPAFDPEYSAQFENDDSKFVGEWEVQ